MAIGFSLQPLQLKSHCSSGLLNGVQLMLPPQKAPKGDSLPIIFCPVFAH